MFCVHTPPPHLTLAQWEPVQFFNNKIICDLVEEKHRGIISILVGLGGVVQVRPCACLNSTGEPTPPFPQDEECLRPGDATDLTFLERLEEKMGNHPHFVS